MTDPAAPRPRFTEDVDVVVEVTTHSAWSGLGERLRALGFREDQREGAPLCRWRRLEIEELRRQGKWKTHEDIERGQREAEDAYRRSQQGVLGKLKDLVAGKG